MKLCQVTTFALFALAAPQSALAGDAVQLRIDQPNAADSTALDSPDAGMTFSERIAAAMAEMDLMVRTGQPIDDALLALQELIDQSPEPASVRERLQIHVRDLAERARQTFIRESDLALLRVQVADALMARVMVALDQRAEAGRWTPEQYAEVSLAFLDRADAFALAPDPAQFRARVALAFSTAAFLGADLASAMREVRVQLLRGRLEQFRELLVADAAKGLRSTKEARSLFMFSVRRAQAIQRQSFPG